MHLLQMCFLIISISGFLYSEDVEWSIGKPIPMNMILETAVQDDKVMQDFDSESLLMGGEHSQKVKAPPIKSDYGSKDCVNLSSSTAVSRMVDHPVSTSNPEAQKFFNKGLTNVFAYNHDLAFRYFEKASQIDPNLAMAYWGMALSLGQNINTDVTPENEKKAYMYSQKALSLLSHASKPEKHYIQALAVRYTNNPNEDLIALRYKYRDAMKNVFELYPEDLDASCLYAESILNINPWKFWTWDGKPQEGTLDVIQILQSILNRNPNHVGANHFFIHAWEESPTPERALLSAFRLTTLYPEGGHLLHMPCHIFMLCGYYEDAIKTSQRAIQADLQYIKEYGMGGEYPLHYLTHNYKILIRAYMLTEDYDNAIKTVDTFNKFLGPHYDSHEHLTKNLIVPIEVNLYFHRWQDLINSAPQATENPFVLAYWHFSRALAYLNVNDINGYQKERNLMNQLQQKIDPAFEVANNPAIKIVELSQILLDAETAKSQKNLSQYIAKLKAAVDIQDRFEYDEPPPWYIPLRIQLGNALLEDKNYNEARIVFKKGLDEYRRNGRLLSGLYLSIKEENDGWDAFWVEREAKAR